ncbi:DUF829-domain-containing protein [Thozetella sp. PMI_491]|nr:DUF829-domain-containing protein [Thozetella sp. PMI_491]
MKSIFPGFTAVSDRVHILEPASTGTSQDDCKSPAAPRTIILCTWGDGSRKHIAKYIDGYRTLYPASRLILVQSTMFESMFHTVDKHTRSMLPFLDAVFTPTGADKGVDDEHPRTLVHIMSNSGGLSFVSSIMAYQNLTSYGQKKPFPHTLLVCDSTPGGLSFMQVVSRASRAMAIATASWSPLPVNAMHGFWAIVMFITLSVSRLVFGGKEIGWKYEEGIRDPNLTSPNTTRLYLYSQADELVDWKEVEKNIAIVKGKGYNCLAERFEKSPHVGHAHFYPERYWGAIADAWESAIAKEEGFVETESHRSRL